MMNTVVEADDGEVDLNPPPPDENLDTLSLSAIHSAYERIKASDLIVRTPLWKDCNKRFYHLLSSTASSSSSSTASSSSSSTAAAASSAAAAPSSFLPISTSLKSFRLHLKLENFQITGSFKIRGVVNQMLSKASSLRVSGSAPVTMSAGNYGKAFAHCLSSSLGRGIEPGLVVMPTAAPKERVELIRSMGCRVEQVQKSDLQSTVDAHVSQSGMTYLHSFDDVALMAGNGSLGLEILEECRPDVVLVCCGGGGLLAGVATAVKMTIESNRSDDGGVEKRPCAIYGVEPEGAPTMYESFRRGAAFSFPSAGSVASGLSPPYAGRRCYAQCRKYVDDILLVSEEDLRQATALLYDAGVVAEPAGAAAFAALIRGKVPGSLEGKQVCAVVTGSNVSLAQMTDVAEGVELALV